jgi:hypothetical protein
VLMMCFCWPAGAVFCILALVQTLQTDRGHYGRTAAIVSSCVALGFVAVWGGLWGMSAIMSAISSPSSSSP